MFNSFPSDLFRLHSQCDTLFCIIEDKKERRYLNWFTVGIFEPRNQGITCLKKSGRERISGRYNLLFFHQPRTIGIIHQFVQSYQDGYFKEPGGDDFIFADIDESSQSFLGVEQVRKELAGILSTIEYSGWLNELSNNEKVFLREFSDKEQNTINQLIKNHWGISLDRLFEKAGNIILFLPDIRIKSSFRGHPSGDSFMVRLDLHSELGSLDRYYMNVISKIGERIVFSHSESPLRVRSVIPCKDVGSEIVLEIWDKREGCLIHRNSGILIRGIEIQMGMVMGKRIVREIDRNTGKVTEHEVPIITEERISIPKRPKPKRQFKPTHISTSDSLIQQKKLFIYKSVRNIDYRASKQKLIKDIQELLNRHSNEYVKIWDPYLRGEDLEILLPYIGKNLQFCGLTQLELVPEENLEKSKRGESKRKILLEELKKTVGRLRKAKINIKVRWAKCEECNDIWKFHDRFILTKGRGWHLGSSINQKGNKYTVIYEIPFADKIEQDFDELWQKSERYEIEP